jgi:hypothetical protein
VHSRSSSSNSSNSSSRLGVSLEAPLELLHLPLPPAYLGSRAAFSARLHRRQLLGAYLEAPPLLLLEVVCLALLRPLQVCSARLPPHPQQRRACSASPRNNQQPRVRAEGCLVNRLQALVYSANKRRLLNRSNNSSSHRAFSVRLANSNHNNNKLACLDNPQGSSRSNNLLCLELPSSNPAYLAKPRPPPRRQEVRLGRRLPLHLPWAVCLAKPRHKWPHPETFLARRPRRQRQRAGYSAPLPQLLHLVLVPASSASRNSNSNSSSSRPPSASGSHSHRHRHPLVPNQQRLLLLLLRVLARAAPASPPSPTPVRRTPPACPSSTPPSPPCQPLPASRLRSCAGRTTRSATASYSNSLQRLRLLHSQLAR